MAYISARTRALNLYCYTLRPGGYSLAETTRAPGSQPWLIASRVRRHSRRNNVPDPSAPRRSHRFPPTRQQVEELHWRYHHTDELKTSPARRYGAVDQHIR